jgi:hypothetical protein
VENQHRAICQCLWRRSSSRLKQSIRSAPASRDYSVANQYDLWFPEEAPCPIRIPKLDLAVTVCAEGPGADCNRNLVVFGSASKSSPPLERGGLYLSPNKQAAIAMRTRPVTSSPNEIGRADERRSFRAVSACCLMVVASRRSPQGWPTTPYGMTITADK